MHLGCAMRWPLLFLLASAACDPTLDPAPPTALPYPAAAFSVAHDHTLIVTTTQALESAGTEIPSPKDANGNPALTLPALAAVAVGQRHACGLSVTGTVYCWGDHARGALGEHRTCIAPTTEGGVPDCILGAELMPRGLPPVRALAAGDDITCAITASDDRVVCWGASARRGGSRLPPLDPPTPVTLPDGSALAAARVVISHGAVCAITHDARLWCWGDAFGSVPQRLPETGVVDVALGRGHSCLIDDHGLACWGDDRNGQVGDLELARTCGTGPCALTERHHLDLAAPARVVVGERHTCALANNGEVSCWGSNEVGQLGRTDAFLVGAIGPALDGVIDLQAGYAHTCALRGDHTVWCWGSTAQTDPSEQAP